MDATFLAFGSCCGVVAVIQSCTPVTIVLPPTACAVSVAT